MWFSRRLCFAETVIFPILHRTPVSHLAELLLAVRFFPLYYIWLALYQIYRLTNTIAFWCYITLTSDKPSHQLIGMQPTRRRAHLSLPQLIFACDWKMCRICICSAQYDPLLNLRWNDLALISDKPQCLSFKFIMWRKKTSNSDIKMSLSFTVCLLIKLLHTYENTHICSSCSLCCIVCHCHLVTESKLTGLFLCQVWIKWHVYRATHTYHHRESKQKCTWLESV